MYDTPSYVRLQFAKSKGYKYVGNGWFRPIIEKHYNNLAVYMDNLTPEEFEKLVDLNDTDVIFYPVKYNGSFIDTIPQ